MTGSRRIGAAGAISLLAVVLVGASCGGGSAASSDATGTAGTGGGGIPGTPVAQCKEVVATLCNRDNACNPSTPPATAQDLMDCQTLNGIAFGCDRATVSFSDCLTDVKVVSCASLFPAVGSGLPPACNDPIDAIPLSTAQQKCGDLAGVVCERSAGCQGITPTPTQLQNCQLAAFSDLHCLYAIDVSATFDQCLKDLPAFPCQTVPDGGAADGGTTSDASLPSCDDPLVFPP